jgi:hypothetical protein
MRFDREDVRQLVAVMGDIDFQEHDDYMSIKLGGDGDNGEHLIVLIEKALPLIGYVFEGDV